MKTFLALLLSVAAIQANTRPNAHIRKLRPYPLLKSSSGLRRATTQTLTCYDGRSGVGDSVRAIDYIPNLQGYGMDNRIESCCFTGIWMLYADADYNAYNPGSSNWWAYGENYCIDVPAPFSNAASSLRFTGAPDDWKYPTLNFYFNDYFIGDEEFTYNDMPQLNYDNRARSIIVTGCDAWTIYQYDNYRGSSMCLFPGDSSACNPGLYPNSQSLGMLAGTVSSARRGCYAQKKMYPVNYNRGMNSRTAATGQQSGSSGFFGGNSTILSS